MANFIVRLIERNNEEVNKAKRLILNPNDDRWIVKHLGLIAIIFNCVAAVLMCLGVIILTPLFIIMLILNAPYRLYLWLSNLAYFRKIHIKKSLLRYEKQLNLLNPYNLRSIKSLPLVDVPYDLESFLRQFFFKYNSEYWTYDSVNGCAICDKNRRRSTQDVYLISKYYFPEVKLDEVLKTLISLINDKYLGVSKCSDIRKYVFKYRDNYVGVYTGKELEFIEGVTFAQLMEYYE